DVGSPLGARVEFTFQAGEPGPLRILGLGISVSGLDFPMQPLNVEVLPAPGSHPPAPYRWKAPDSVVLWQSFYASLVPKFPDAQELRLSSLPAPAGISLEPMGGNTYAGIALKEGMMVLPGVFYPDGRPAAEPHGIRVRTPPSQIGTSRAVGVFDVLLSVPAGAAAREGEALEVRVEVRGRGNLPLLEPPRVRMRSAAGAEIPSTSSAPWYDLRAAPAAAGAYEGAVAREHRFFPGIPGVYILEAEPFAFLDAEAGIVRTVRSAPIRLLVSPAPETADSRAGVDPRLAAALARYASSPGPLGKAAGLASAGRLEEGIIALEGIDSPEALHLRGALHLTRGDTARSLAYLGRAERMRQGLPGLADLLSLWEETSGAGPRMRDRLPEPRNFWFLSVVVVLFLLAAGFRERMAAVRRTALRRAARAEGRPGWAAFLLPAAAVLALTAGAVSVLERRVSFIVVDSGEGYAVPSESASSSAFTRGRSGTAESAVGDWVLVRFPDGGHAWFRGSDILRY
ncbi:MAG TPA: hypothetical protein VLH39_00605, partial [Magnetospirillaceae bacterium]|nr:hypothetical protein [Magnetospirillaceae bacterium]